MRDGRVNGAISEEYIRKKTKEKEEEEKEEGSSSSFGRYDDFPLPS